MLQLGRESSPSHFPTIHSSACQGYVTLRPWEPAYLKLMIHPETHLITAAAPYYLRKSCLILDANIGDQFRIGRLRSIPCHWTTTNTDIFFQQRMKHLHDEQEPLQSPREQWHSGCDWAWVGTRIRIRLDFILDTLLCYGTS